nr:hypothetical protein [Amycolatopsis antarctica]
MPSRGDECRGIACHEQRRARPHRFGGDLKALLVEPGVPADQYRGGAGFAVVEHRDPVLAQNVHHPVSAEGQYRLGAATFLEHRGGDDGRRRHVVGADWETQLGQ